MARIRLRHGLACVMAAGVIVLACSLIPIEPAHWDGGFPSVEYQLLFMDRQGRPLPGVTLRVESKGGRACYFYPVNEFLPDFAPVSGNDGRMTFHHVSAGVEFSGSDNGTSLGFMLWSEKPPQYDCLFLIEEREVKRLHFNNLNQEIYLEGSPQRVSRAWSDPDWARYAPADGDWDSRVRELFNGDRKQKLDREQALGANKLITGFNARGQTQEKVEMEFLLYERTILLGVNR